MKYLPERKTPFQIRETDIRKGTFWTGHFLFNGRHNNSKKGRLSIGIILQENYKSV